MRSELSRAACLEPPFLPRRVLFELGGRSGTGSATIISTSSSDTSIGPDAKVPVRGEESWCCGFKLGNVFAVESDDSVRLGASINCTDASASRLGSSGSP